MGKEKREKNLTEGWR